MTTAKPRARISTKAPGERTTRDAILEAAQLRLARLGSDGIRLQDIARDAGVSHPTILHHFGSRDGLIVALVKHIGENFVSEIIQRIPLGMEHVANDESKVGLAFELLADKEFGVLIGWAFRQRPGDVVSLLENLFNMAFESMVQYKQALDGTPPSEVWKCQLEYSIRVVLLAAAGERIIGKSLPFLQGDESQFRTWISEQISNVVGI